MALEALVDHFDRQNEDREEMLASRMDTESAARTPGLVEF